jgi:Holliday junction resolvase RusA-like endonuclease
MKSTIKVDKIRSYQTLVYKNGYRTFRKKDYTLYSDKIKNQIQTDETYDKDIEVSIQFMSNTRTLGDLDNITKPILDILQDMGIIKNDRNITKMILEKSFNSKENIIQIEIGERNDST